MFEINFALNHFHYDNNSFTFSQLIDIKLKKKLF